MIHSMYAEIVRATNVLRNDLSAGRTRHINVEIDGMSSHLDLGWGFDGEYTFYIRGVQLRPDCEERQGRFKALLFVLSSAAISACARHETITVQNVMGLHLDTHLRALGWNRREPHQSFPEGPSYSLPVLDVRSRYKEAFTPSAS